MTGMCLVASCLEDGGGSLNDVSGPYGICQRRQARLCTDDAVLELLNEHRTPVGCDEIGEGQSAAHGAVGTTDAPSQPLNGGHPSTSGRTLPTGPTRCDR